MYPSKATLFVLVIVLLCAKSFCSSQNLALDSNEWLKIEERANLLNEKTGYRIEFKFDSFNKIKKPKNEIGKGFLIEIDTVNVQARISSGKSGFSLNHQYYDQLVRQYILPGIESENLAVTLLWMIDDMEKAIENESALVKIRASRNDSSYTFEFMAVFYTFIFIGIAYLVKSGHKFSQTVNKAEYWEYYGFSRLSLVQKILLPSILIGGIVVFIFQYVFYYDEVILLCFCLLVLARPLALFSGYVFKLVNDYYLVKRTPITKSNSLSLGQKLFLLRPKLHTEEYMLLDLYELIMNGALKLTPELMEPAYKNRYRNFINLNTDKPKVSSSFQKLILDQFEMNREKYFLPNKLVSEVMGEVGSFKSYKKDFLVFDLVKSGICDQKDWILNRFRLTKDGNLLKQQLVKHVKSVGVCINNYLYEGLSEEIDLDKIGTGLLLIPNSEDRIDDLYHKLLNEGLLHDATQSKLGVLLEPSFSFADFRGAIRREIREAHESNLGEWGDD